MNTNKRVRPLLLGVNIDHVATLRNQRDARYPDPVQAALVAEQAGADSLTVHLREDRRHIRERDIELIQAVKTTPLNLEMAVTPHMLAFAKSIQPEEICLVPEKREERTTEGGLDVIQNLKQIEHFVSELQTGSTVVSLFIEACQKQIEAAKKSGAKAIEIHTGTYVDAKCPNERALELSRIVAAADYAAELGLVVNAGHGLDYHTVQAVAEIDVIHTLNIGYAIIARALFTGLDSAVREMKANLM